MFAWYHTFRERGLLPEQAHMLTALALKENHDNQRPWDHPIRIGTEIIAPVK